MIANVVPKGFLLGTRPAPEENVAKDPRKLGNSSTIADELFVAASNQIPPKYVLKINQKFMLTEAQAIGCLECPKHRCALSAVFQRFDSCCIIG